MKKKLILFSFSLLVLGILPTRAQFVVSLHLNGMKPSFSQTTDYSTLYRNYIYNEEYTPGNPIPTYTLVRVDDSVVTDQKQYDSDNIIAIGGGLKVGYQMQRIQFGISGTFNWHYTSADQDAERYIGNNPYCDVQSLIAQSMSPDSTFLEGYEGWFTEYSTSFTIAPYVRYELVQAGDLALFVEANAFYSKANKPQHHDYLDWTYHEMHSTIDTSFAIDRSTVSFGALVTPGLSWQLSPNCLVDLYFDCLALGYRTTKETIVNVIDEYDYTATPRVLSRRTTITTTIEDSHLGFDLNAAPMANRNFATWVRVGFSYTF